MEENKKSQSQMEAESAKHEEQKGLSSEEAKQRLEKHGPNELEKAEETTPLDILISQIKENVLVWILIFAAVASFAAGEMAEFYFVVIIIAIIVVMGFLQEWKAEKAMQELQKLTVPEVKVFRDGKLQDVSSSELVPGDIIKIEMGDKIPADAQVVDSHNLEVDEAILTGESEPVAKNDDDEIYSGTVVSRGRCEAQISATGMDTKLGEIADELQQGFVESPLQRKVRELAKKLGYIAIIVSLALLLIGVITGAETSLIMTTAIAVAVAVVPEALPLVITLTLSLGMKGMAEQNALVRKMLAVEGLGSTTVICTDKTGTLTRNEMTVKRILTGNNELTVEGSGYLPRGNILQNEETVNISENKPLEELLNCAALCNNAELFFENDEEEVHGEPTEASLVTLAEKAGYNHQELRNKHEKIEEILFTSDRKRMTTIHESPDWENNRAYMKGAPEVVLERCTHVLEKDGKKPLTEDIREEILDYNQKFADEAMRVLAFAYREDTPVSSSEDEVEKEMTFLGLTGIIDPPRDEVEEAIQKCKSAGVQVKMVTGDNANTARAIAKRINLTENPRVITGAEMDEMSEEELTAVIEEVDIYARTHPGNKTQIIKALQNHGEIVAMTGDGVNDAPAVNNADVGIGMGIKGSDVTKEASDIVLQDDNFGTIEKAIESGRRIYDNIEKFTTFLLSRNFTEVILIASVLAITRDFALLPLLGMQVLFLNMIGQVGPGLGLGVDPADEDIMNRSPRDADERLLNTRNLTLVTSMAVTMVAMAAFSFNYGLQRAGIELARTMTFTSISVMIMINAFNFRSLEKSIFGELNPFKNKWIIAATLITIPLVLIALYVPVMQEIFGHIPLGLSEWIVAGGTGLATLILLEIVKRIIRILEL